MGRDQRQAGPFPGDVPPLSPRPPTPPRIHCFFPSPPLQGPGTRPSSTWPTSRSSATRPATATSGAASARTRCAPAPSRAGWAPARWVRPSFARGDGLKKKKTNKIQTDRSPRRPGVGYPPPSEPEGSAGVWGGEAAAPPFSSRMLSWRPYAKYIRSPGAIFLFFFLFVCVFFVHSSRKRARVGGALNNPVWGKERRAIYMFP